MLNVAITTLGGLVTSVDKFLLQRLLKNNNITTITTGSNLFMIVTSGIFTSIEMPCLNDLVVFIVAGVLGLVGQVFSTKATRLGNHSQLAPYYYSIFIFGVGIECLIHGNLPSLRNLIATGIIVSAMVINK
jgi:drug/metabolite transporter (DMT)-like permease